MAEALGAGSRLGDYRIEEEIGRGGMGIVYRATQERLGRPVAIKLIAPELARDATFRRRFERESHLAASIEHPNAVPIYEAGEAPDGTVYIAMRLVDGTDLAALLRADRWLEPERATRVVEQVAGALDAAHARGLVHRDVKPSNILLGESESGDWAYLTDFGLTKPISEAGELTGSGEWVGTIDYASPEQIQGKPLDARSDVYSLGCVLFEALSGRLPFEREEQIAKLYAHLSDPPPALTEQVPDAPAALDAVVHRALAKDPDERYPSAGDLARAASAAVAGTAVTEPERSVATGAAATGTAPTRRLRPRGLGGLPSRRARLAAVAALVAVVAVAAGAIALLGGGDAPRVAGETEVGDHPIAVTVGEGYVWVSNQGDDTVSRLDPDTGDVVGDPIRVGASPAGIRVGDGYVWVTNQVGDSVSRIDPDTDRVVGDPTRVGNRPSGLKTGEGYVWVTNVGDDTVSRLDPRSAEPAGGPIRVGHSPAGVAVGEGSVWVANSGDGTVSRIAPGSGDLVGDPIRVGARPRGITAGEGSIWVANALDGSVSRIDPLSAATVGSPTRVGKRPAGIATGEGYVWVANELDGTVSRIDPDSGRVAGDPVAVGSHPRGIAVGEGFVWVVNSDDDSVTRIEP